MTRYCKTGLPSNFDPYTFLGTMLKSSSYYKQNKTKTKAGSVQVASCRFGSVRRFDVWFCFGLRLFPNFCFSARRMKTNSPKSQHYLKGLRAEMWLPLNKTPRSHVSLKGHLQLTRLGGGLLRSASNTQLKIIPLFIAALTTFFFLIFFFRASAS